MLNLVSQGNLGGDCHTSLGVAVHLWWFAGCENKEYRISSTHTRYTAKDNFPDTVQIRHAKQSGKE